MDLETVAFPHVEDSIIFKVRSVSSNDWNGGRSLIFTAKGTLTYAVLIINIMNFIHSQAFFLIQLLLLGREKKKKKLNMVFAESGKMLNLICWNKRISKEIKSEELCAYNERRIQIK